MHLLVAQPGTISDGSDAIDLAQTPGDIVYISAADTELNCLAQALKVLSEEFADFPSVRLANMMTLNHNMSVDIYVETIIKKAKIVLVRVLGGRTYWPYGIDEIVATCTHNAIPLALLPGDDQPDIELMHLSSIDQEMLYKIWQFQVHGGINNASGMLSLVSNLIGREKTWIEPEPLVRTGLYWPKTELPDLNIIQSNWIENAPVVALIFYRALVQAGNVEVINMLILELMRLNLNPLPIFTQSLKDKVSAGILESIFFRSKPDIILNSTGFSVSSPGAESSHTPFEVGRDNDPPMVIQMVFSGSGKENWKVNNNGLSARDVAMNVALPEVDGRVFTRAISFKEIGKRDKLTEADLVSYVPSRDRVKFVCELAKCWVTLRITAIKERRIAIVVANYPNQDGRIGNGVGLDTPESAVKILKAMKKEGYSICDIPKDGKELLKRLKVGPTNNYKDLKNRIINETLSAEKYRVFFDNLPEQIKIEVKERWGVFESDPFYTHQTKGNGFFAISGFRLGNIIICLQPARGYNINPKETYHSPDLVPPHNYLAFYAWLRLNAKIHAIINLGKHGNLEWLPGKSLALSAECYPEVALGPTPNIYPFIVNDPGEGAQAKRRASAVIIDHLTPALTRAESYGPLRDLEQLVDEYFEASGVDPRRLEVLKKNILMLCETTGLDKDCGFIAREKEDTSLMKLDNYLCELKEMQIRDGLHIFGESPKNSLLDSLLVALTRVPRNDGKGKDASFIRMLARDLKLNFDPLDCVMGETWEGSRPKVLNDLLTDQWRTVGDTVERLEILALNLVSGKMKITKNFLRAIVVFKYLQLELRPLLETCGDEEIRGIIQALNGNFVKPGPSGAPTRGRIDVLPSGRNFYSVDTRIVPTPAAWTLGWNSASLLVERHMQEHGSWPKNLVISAWGTSNMRTGGDDIAQALAFLGVKPTWDASSRRVNGFEVMPVNVLGRPRVDVTLRISGFFRDAFPALIDLFNSAVVAVSNLDESPEENPVAQEVKKVKKQLLSAGLDEEETYRRSRYRVFGSKPGAYGAGLQALIDEKGWTSDDDLARAYVAWGGYAYGGGSHGNAEHSLFETRLQKMDIVVQNQDNREHDILDSDDYYQFEGGITAAVRYFSGSQPTIYHNDHSRPESPRIRSLNDEIARVVRARAANPKWIRGVMNHGYKGAFEIAATVDYLFAFAATAQCVGHHHFDILFDAYLVNSSVRDFLEEKNPKALEEIANRFTEAEARGLWKSKRNDTKLILENILLRVEKNCD